MSFSTSVCFCDGTSSMNYTHRKSLSELEVICFDTRNMPEIPSLVSENIFKTLSLPLRPNNFDLLSILLPILVYMDTSTQTNAATITVTADTDAAAGGTKNWRVRQLN